jgi:hypothetical protein
MKHLRIKFMGKLDQLLLGYFEPLGFEPITRFQVIEVVLFHSEVGEITFMSHRPGLSNV